MEILIDKFILYGKTQIFFSPHTERAYRSDLKQFIYFVKNNNLKNIDEIDSIIVRKYISYISSLNLERNSIIRKISAVRSFINYLYENKFIKSNPFDIVSVPKKYRTLPSFLTEAEIVKLIDENRPDKVRIKEKNYKFAERDFALLLLLYSTGIRRSEAVGINIGDIDFLSGFITIYGKGRKERMVPIGDMAIKAIKNYLDTRTDKGPGLPLFVNAYNKRLSSTSIFLILKKMAKRARFTRNIKPHMFRHSFATHLLNNGCDIRAVSEMLGHSSLNTTQIYTHISIEKLRDIYNKCHPRARND